MNFTGESFLPSGATEIPETDYGWETYIKRMPEIVVSGSDIDDQYQEVRRALAPDDTLEWTLELHLTGAAAINSSIKVVAPTGSVGGFVHWGMNMAGSFQNNAYGADDFNTTVGSLRGGAGGSLLGYDVHTFQGSIKCGDTPGLLKFQLTTSSSILKVMAGTILRVRPMGGPS